METHFWLTGYRSTHSICNNSMIHTHTCTVLSDFVRQPRWYSWFSKKSLCSVTYAMDLLIYIPKKSKYLKTEMKYVTVVKTNFHFIYPLIRKLYLNWWSGLVLHAITDASSFCLFLSSVPKEHVPFSISSCNPAIVVRRNGDRIYSSLVSRRPMVKWITWRVRAIRHCVIRDFPGVACAQFFRRTGAH